MIIVLSSWIIITNAEKRKTLQSGTKFMNKACIRNLQRSVKSKVTSHACASESSLGIQVAVILHLTYIPRGNCWTVTYSGQGSVWRQRLAMKAVPRS
jgi:hypothetical protein